MAAILEKLEPNLTPCPFCGSRCLRLNRLSSLTKYFGTAVPRYVVCDTCRAHGPDTSSADYAFTIWNKRIGRGSTKP